MQMIEDNPAKSLENNSGTTQVNINDLTQS